MTKKDVEKWLDAQIRARKKLAELEYLTDEVSAVSGVDERIHIYRGIESIAKCLGVELIVRNDGIGRYPVKKYFFYKNGVEVFQLYEQEEVSTGES